MKRYYFVFIMLIMGTISLIAQDGGESSGGFNVWQIISAILAITTTLFGALMSKFRGKLKQILNLGKETLE